MGLDPVKNSNTLVIDVKSHFSWLIFFKSDQIIRNGGQRVGLGQKHPEHKPPDKKKPQ